MSKDGYIDAVPNQPLIINNNRKMLDSAEILASEFSFSSSAWFAEPDKSLNPKLAKKLLKTHPPKPQENK